MMDRSNSMFLGIADYYRFPERRISWGGPFNGQSGRQQLFGALIANTAPKAIIETGTYRGTTTEFMAKTGLPLYTIEGQARNYGFALARLWLKRNVHLYQGDSREVLRKLMDSKLLNLGGHILFAYLDAHWNADLPLKEELEIIYGHCPAAVVMIDDFQVPDDPRYQFDDYGPGKSISLPYIEPVLSAYDLEAHYPSMPSSQETGARRGCAVLANTEIHGKSLRDLSLLRQSPKSGPHQVPFHSNDNAFSTTD